MVDGDKRDLPRPCQRLRERQANEERTDQAGALGDGHCIDGGKYAEQFNFVRCMSIAGGSDEINKNVIGERALGLPREPDANKGLPYREVLARTKAAAT